MTHRKLATVPAHEPSRDAALLARVAEGDLSALGTLYDHFAPAILRYASRLASTEDAEDVVQTVFVRVVGAARSFDRDAESARPWLYGIATRVALEQRRSLRRFAALVTTLSVQPRATAENPVEARSSLQRALSKLSPQKRAVLLLAEGEGFSCDEISEMLEIPVGTVWTRLHHARRELQKLRDKGVG